MRFHHHTTRALQAIGKTKDQIIILQIIPPNRQARSAAGHRSCGIASKTNSTVSQTDPTGSAVHVQAARSGKQVQVLHHHSMRSRPRSGDRYLPASQG